MKKRNMIMLAIGTLFVVATLGAWIHMERWYKESEEIYEAIKIDFAQDVRAAIPKMKEDQKALQVYAWMHDNPCENDAGLVLNALVEWDNESAMEWSKNHSGSIDRPDWSKMGDLSMSLLKKVPDSKHWITQGANTQIAALRFPWMKELRSFDCWDITKNSPIANQDFKDVTDWVDRMTYPSGVGLMSASTLMLMQLHQPLSDNPEEDSARVERVLNDVRKLVQLTLKSQHMILMGVGVSILEREQQATMYLAEHDRVPSNWKTIPASDIARLKRLVYASSSLSSLFTPVEFHDVITTDEYSFARCASMREGFQQARMFKGVLEKEQFSWLEKVLSQSQKHGCRLDDVVQQWNDPDLNLENQEEYKGIRLLKKMMRGQAMILATIAVPNWLSRYTQ